MDERPLAIVAAGVLCPIGLDTDMAAASARAGIARTAESSVIGHRLEPIVLGYVPDDVLPPLADGLGPRTGLTSLQARMLRLASPALQEAQAAAGPDAIPLILAGPMPAPGEPPIIDDDLLKQLATQAGVNLDLAASKVVSSGHAAVFAAVRQAAQDYLWPGRARQVLVGGVDSFVDPRRLDGLQSEGRVLAPGILDGFTPGEGAAFLLLTTERICRQDRIAPLAHIAAVGLGHEKGHRNSDAAYTGDGLAQAFAAVFDQAGSAGSASPVQTIYAGFTGEQLHAKEWGVAFLRNREHFAEGSCLEHPAEDTGDMGAALGPVMLALCTAGLSQGWMRGPALVWTTSDGPERGAALLTGGALHGAG